MADFMIRFLLCNVLISGFLGILLFLKGILKNSLTPMLHYLLWFLLLGLLAVPFLPLPLIGVWQLIPQLLRLGSLSAANTQTSFLGGTDQKPPGPVLWMEDFTLSVNSQSPDQIWYLLAGLWIAGILVMLLSLVKSFFDLCRMEKSALLLEKPEILLLYSRCLSRLSIKKEIPIYSTAYLKSPVMIGIWKPRIYLPLSVISDYREPEMCYILLHELQHYRHKDALTGCLMGIFKVLYWFNPFVRYAVKKMLTDREIACDTSVLMVLDERDYADYGNALLRFCEKGALTAFPFTAGLNGNNSQMHRRILNIASYVKPTPLKQWIGAAFFFLVAAFFLCLSPLMSTYAREAPRYRFDFSSESITDLELSSYFGQYDGSFVFYDLQNDSWSIYNRERAVLQVSPDSTYKLYTALFGLEEGVITPEDSGMSWDNESYPFEEWNQDQTLASAMSASVNWYFEEIDKQIGTEALSGYLEKIRYGNRDVSGSLSPYWMESSLKISPVEQVALITELYRNSFGFSPANIDTVKNSIRLFSGDTGTLYGKTGTGRVDGKDVNGWFIGFMEHAGNAYFFAVNIGADANADGKKAAAITLSVLSDLGFLTEDSLLRY